VTCSVKRVGYRGWNVNERWLASSWRPCPATQQVCSGTCCSLSFLRLRSLCLTLHLPHQVPSLSATASDRRFRVCARSPSDAVVCGWSDRLCFRMRLLSCPSGNTRDGCKARPARPSPAASRKLGPSAASMATPPLRGGCAELLSPCS
jgi:hypothetical protein